MSGAAAQYAALSRRAVVSIIRRPTAVVPAMVFPLLFLAMTSAAMGRSIALPGFPPVDSFLQFAIAATLIQAALFGAVSAGTDMAVDIEDGFFERLIASPVARSSILAGRLMGAAALGFVQTWFLFAVTFPFGLRVAGGLPAVVLISLVTALIAAGIGAVSVTFALRTGSAEAVQGSFPLLFAGLFLSSAFFPRALMDGWFKAVATVNPLSHMVEGIRTQVVEGLDLGAYAAAFGVAAGIFVFGIALSGLALRARLAAHA